MAAKKSAIKKSTAKKPAAAKPAAKKPVAQKAPAKKPAAKKPAAKKPAAKKKKKLTGEARYNAIQEAAYYIAEASGFTRDNAECWSEAEKQIKKQFGS